MKARREALERVDRSATTHAGLWLDRYLSVQNDQRNPGSTEGVGEKANHFRSVESTAVPRGYVEACDRWRQSLPADHTALVIDIQAEGRIALGLGDKGVLENGLTLSHTWGVPFIPGSALKGVAAAAAHLLAHDDGWRKGTSAHARKGEHHADLFGQGGAGLEDGQSVDHIGRVCFLDAWWNPAGAQSLPIALDVMTVHHAGYYQKDEAPLDTDSPNPVPFATVSGRFLLALVLTDPADDPAWLDRALDLLRLGLTELGIGAKTNAGYGRMTVAVPDVTRAQAEEEHILARLPPEARWARLHQDLLDQDAASQAAWLLANGRGSPSPELTDAAWRGLIGGLFGDALARLRADAAGGGVDVAALEADLHRARQRSIDKKDDTARRRRKREIEQLEKAIQNVRSQGSNVDKALAPTRAFLAWLDEEG
ncbi:MAG: type III-B CRISPR module RAMP protein Cmr6 [Myxococcales bacterium]|nr:type III-B CRISPR module RAMP protein Cmr6 [Myxococcales bacterium]